MCKKFFNNKKILRKKNLLILHLTKHCTPESREIFACVSTQSLKNIFDGIFTCLKCSFGSIHSAYAYNHNWDFFEHSFDFFSLIPIFCATETTLHSYTFVCASCSQSGFSLCICANCSTRFFCSSFECHAITSRWLVTLNEQKIKNAVKKISGMSNVNQARAFFAFTVHIRCDDGNSCRSTWLHYNLLPRNYKLVVVSDISQLQQTHSYWKRPNWLHWI